ncbi:MAG: type II toxin-antitoxin system RelE/ParE family toxin, partial [Xenococcus sp. (in: cyanobacteria)]
SFKSSAAKELRKLSLEVQQRIASVIEKLIDNPRFSGVVKLKGDDNLYRFRVGEYRVIYEIDDSDKKIVITRIRHRRDVYR